MNTLEMHTLLFCSDANFLHASREVLAQLGATTRIIADRNSAVAAIQLDNFDVIILDWPATDNFSDFISAVRRSKLNRDCMLVAIGCGLPDLRVAFAAGMQFFIHKPAAPVQIERCLRAAYSFSAARRVKRHREPIDALASIRTHAQTPRKAMVSNLGEGGARLRLAPGSSEVANLNVGDEVELRFALPETNDVFQGTGVVVWTSPECDAGIRFSYIPGYERLALEHWLRACVERSVSQRHERLRRACA
jgi:DNA-binding NarL/FixJ family response regulator